MTTIEPPTKLEDKYLIWKNLSLLPWNKCWHTARRTRIKYTFGVRGGRTYRLTDVHQFHTWEEAMNFADWRVGRIAKKRALMGLVKPDPWDGPALELSQNAVVSEEMIKLMLNLQRIPKGPSMNTTFTFNLQLDELDHLTQEAVDKMVGQHPTINDENNTYKSTVTHAKSLPDGSVDITVIIEDQDHEGWRWQPGKWISTVPIQGPPNG